jgi:hypothetical protein
MVTSNILSWFWVVHLVSLGSLFQVFGWSDEWEHWCPENNVSYGFSLGTNHVDVLKMTVYHCKSQIRSGWC